VKSATRIERLRKVEAKRGGSDTEEVRGTSHRPRPGPILATHRTGREKLGPSRRKPRQETLSNSQQTPPPPPPQLIHLFSLIKLTHVLVGNFSFSKLVVAKRVVGVGCLPRQTNKQILLIIVYVLPQVLKYSTNASPKFHGERSINFYNYNIIFQCFFFFCTPKIPW
jgi:hypothetical protein